MHGSKMAVFILLVGIAVTGSTHARAGAGACLKQWNKDHVGNCFKARPKRPAEAVNWKCDAPPICASVTPDQCTCSGKITFYSDHEFKNVVAAESDQYTLTFGRRSSPGRSRVYQKNVKRSVERNDDGHANAPAAHTAE